jgi:hypothetical protein
MNPNIRVHKDLGVESHQVLQHEKKQSLTSNQSGSEMYTTELAARCVGEIQNFRCGEPSGEKYSLELLRRATVQGEQESRVWIQQCFSELVISWLRGHPRRGAACKIDSEENYVARAFERFWQVTVLTRHVEFHSLASALQYLQACLNGVVLDILRANTLSKEMPVPKPGESRELEREINLESNAVWDTLKKVIPNRKEQRLAYLLFQCGLKPKQIVSFSPQEFGDIHEIYRVRSNILNRLQRDTDL